MKVVDLQGVEKMIENTPDEDPPVPGDAKGIDSTKSKIVGALIGRGYSQADVAKIMGISVRTVKRRWRSVKPGTPIPRLAPVFGVDPNWSPEVEDWRQVAEICPRCGGEIGPIQVEAALVCLACGRSGYDDQVKADRSKDRQDEARREAARKAEVARRRAARGARLARKSG